MFQDVRRGCPRFTLLALVVLSLVALLGGRLRLLLLLLTLALVAGALGRGLGGLRLTGDVLQVLRERVGRPLLVALLLELHLLGERLLHDLELHLRRLGEELRLVDDAALELADGGVDELLLAGVALRLPEDPVGALQRVVVVLGTDRDEECGDLLDRLLVRLVLLGRGLGLGDLLEELLGRRHRLHDPGELGVLDLAGHRALRVVAAELLLELLRVAVEGPVHDVAEHLLEQADPLLHHALELGDVVGELGRGLALGDHRHVGRLRIEQVGPVGEEVVAVDEEHLRQVHPVLVRDELTVLVVGLAGGLGGAREHHGRGHDDDHLGRLVHGRGLQLLGLRLERLGDHRLDLLGRHVGGGLDRLAAELGRLGVEAGHDALRLVVQGALRPHEPDRLLAEGVDEVEDIGGGVDALGLGDLIDRFDDLLSRDLLLERRDDREVRGGGGGGHGGVLLGLVANGSAGFTAGLTRRVLLCKKGL